MILAIDSSAGTAVALTDGAGAVLARQETRDRRSHAEVIGPLIQQVMAEANASPADITAVVMGVGPGPFTGLRVGIAAAQSFAWAQSLPVWPVRSHDAAAVDLLEDIVVVSDARRGEWAVTRYCPHPDGGQGVRIGDTVLISRGELDENQRERDGARIVWLDHIDPVGLVRGALAVRSRGEDLEAPRPIYLREPDVTMPQ